uniref:Uncharacterized protein LOC114324195 n=1 Tax=Diabrotica virgifera virgifera TaxID=50390 RepID=A0A6P7F1G7_DIAVI
MESLPSTSKEKRWSRPLTEDELLDLLMKDDDSEILRLSDADDANSIADLNDVSSEFGDDIQDIEETIFDGLIQEQKSTERVQLAEINLVKSELTKLQSLIDNQQKDIEIIKKDKRSKILVLNGIEEKEKEDIYDVVVKLIQQKFKIPINTNNIDNCYRMGKKRPHNKKPRPVALKFVNKWMKIQVFGAKKGLKGSGIVISEMLSQENRELYLKVKESVGARNCWTFEGNIYTLVNNTKTLIKTISDLGN